MNESEFVDIFEKAANQIIGNKLNIIKGANLYYELSLDKNLQLSVDLSKKPMRGNSAFQTDICIFEKSRKILIPRVVIEFKTGISTHDVITYSCKAGKHKKIYPWLRYGLLASEHQLIPDRFFIHNEFLDFFITAKKFKKGDKLLSMVKDLINKEVRTSRTLEKIFFGENQYNYYRTETIFRDFK